MGAKLRGTGVGVGFGVGRSGSGGSHPCGGIIIGRDRRLMPPPPLSLPLLAERQDSGRPPVRWGGAPDASLSGASIVANKSAPAQGGMVMNGGRSPDVSPNVTEAADKMH